MSEQTEQGSLMDEVNRILRDGGDPVEEAAPPIEVVDEGGEGPPPGPGDPAYRAEGPAPGSAPDGRASVGMTQEEWEELVGYGHDLESMAAEMLTKIDEAAMPEKIKTRLNRIMGKVLYINFKDVTIDAATKLLLGLYAAGQVAYVLAIFGAVKQRKEEQGPERKPPGSGKVIEAEAREIPRREGDVDDRA